MEYGIHLAPSAQAWRVVRRAEELGFSHAWFYDTQLISADPFVAMAAAAMVTSRIRLGTGVLIPSNRIAPVAANALASLNRLAPGRIDFGVGTGFTARRSMGLNALPLREIAAYVRAVSGLLAGETVECVIESAPRRIRFLNPEAGLIDLDHRIPLHLSAMGPKSRALTAELGAGWIGIAAQVPAAESAIAEMQQAWRAAGREGGDLHATAFTAGCVLAENEPADSPRAKAQAGPFAAVPLHEMVEASERGRLNMGASPALAQALDRYRSIIHAGYDAAAPYLDLHRGHTLFLRPEEADVITGDLIREMTFTATVPELRERLRALARAGFRQVAVLIVEGQEDMLEDWARVIEGV